MNGNFKFIALRSCGHVVSHKAVRELNSHSSCPVCHSPSPDLPSSRIILHGDEEEKKVARGAMEEKVAKRAAGSKKKKSKGVQQAQEASEGDRKVNGTGLADGSADGMTTNRGAYNESASKAFSKPNGQLVEVKERAIDEKEAGNGARKVGVGIHMSKATHGMAQEGEKGRGGGKKRGAEEMEERNVSGKRGSTGTSNGSDSRPKGSDLVVQPKTWKAGNHVPDGATADVYKSIFTSSSKQKLEETYSCRSLPLARF